VNVLDEQLKKAKSIRKEWAKCIIKWEKSQGRKFSWRVNRTPYKVLISEILLKRTTSTAALRVYDKFIEKYPDIFTLSKATYDDLEELIRPIGLYKQRTKQLKEISKYFTEDLKGEIPPDYDILIKAPGVGDYTASAILSFAYHIPKAIVDSNVERVLKRVFKVKGKKLHEIAEILVPSSEPDIYNYGMLDMGAVVCNYRTPKCNECLINMFCITMFHEKDSCKN
jgi:A/G-specific adenine glycosylase